LIQITRWRLKFGEIANAYFAGQLHVDFINARPRNQMTKSKIAGSTANLFSGLARLLFEQLIYPAVVSRLSKNIP
jgi:hypothetical protein